MFLLMIASAVSARVFVFTEISLVTLILCGWMVSLLQRWQLDQWRHILGELRSSRCPVCRYQLDGLGPDVPPRCPECGAPIQEMAATAGAELASVNEPIATRAVRLSELPPQAENEKKGLFSTLLNPRRRALRWTRRLLFASALGLFAGGVLMEIDRPPSPFSIILLVGSGTLLLILAPFHAMRAGRRHQLLTMIGDFERGACPGCGNSHSAAQGTTCARCGRDAEAMYRKACRIIPEEER